MTARRDDDGVLEWLIRRGPAGGRARRGDDAAKLRLSGDYAFSIDTQELGRHLPLDAAPATLARRLLAVSLSDLAASGALPEFGLLALAAPADFPFRTFFRALGDAAKVAGFDLVGGDLAAAARPRAALLVAGRRPPRARLLSRSDARPGDSIWVGGALGESAWGQRLLAAGARVAPSGRLSLPPRLAALAGEQEAVRAALRRHLEPRAQLALGLALGRRRRAAAIDVSDGLALDLHRLCRRSGVGARIERARLPIAASVERLAAIAPRQRPDPGAAGWTAAERLALAGGEDYVLLFTLPPGVAPPRGRGLDRCRRIGEVEAGRRVVLVEADGRTRPLPASGHRHWASPARAGR